MAEFNNQIKEMEIQFTRRMAELETKIGTLKLEVQILKAKSYPPVPEGGKVRRKSIPKLDGDGNTIPRAMNDKQKAMMALRQLPLLDQTGAKYGMDKKPKKDGGLHCYGVIALSSKPRYNEQLHNEWVNRPEYKAYVAEYGEVASVKSLPTI